MDRGRVGEDRGSKETDGCPLTCSLWMLGLSVKTKVDESIELLSDEGSDNELQMLKGCL
jgi:hypothetical protein